MKSKTQKLFLGTFLLCVAAGAGFAAVHGDDPASQETARKENQDPALQSEPRENALTPMDQSNAPADLALTQQIRQALMADASLSMQAKNVKVITIGGKVTLRGPVKDPLEKTHVESLASGVAGHERIDSQLEVA
ncbi:MAG TPA: BON domain-containing protein [Verrucomicrobiae bacterium]|jgi:osmotically-inducible protein OsmY|nr:BON domain-containing protein [Verrucomicrobiae bacterium]